MIRKNVRKFLINFVVLVVFLANLSVTDIAYANTKSTRTLDSSKYLNATLVNLHLGSKDAGTFDFDIMSSVNNKGASYYWYVKKDSGNPDAITIDNKTGIVTAIHTGTAYIRCRITYADGTVLRPEACIIVLNNITSVNISNTATNRIVTTGDTVDFNRAVLNTEAGADMRSTGITRWEVKEDTAGVGSPTKEGIVQPTKEGSFLIRAICFQNNAEYATWLKNQTENSDLITASSDWSTVTVIDANHQTVVATQSQLENALADENSKLVTVSTKGEIRFIINKGDYLDKNLIVDAPNSDVENYALFKNIIIKAIKDSTWIEYANGNIIHVDDTQSRIIIDENSQVKEIVIDRPNSVLNIIANGRIDQITMSQPTQVNVEGTSTNIPTITVEGSAEGSKISSSVPVSLDLKADTVISLNPGAEGTTLNRQDASITVEVNNATEEAVHITTDNKEEQAVKPGESLIQKGIDQSSDASEPSIAPSAAVTPILTTAPVVTEAPAPATVPIVQIPIPPTTAPTTGPTPIIDRNPIAVDDHYNVNQNGGYLFTPLDNDSDSDGDTLTISKINQGVHGIVERGYGASQYRYVANTGYCGPDSFTYEISDGHNGIATATVYFTVNALPTAVNDSAIVGKGSSVVIDVLSNDSNPAGGTLSIWEFTQGARGHVTQEGNSLKYVPDSSFYGTDSFTYKLLNDFGALSTATVNVTADNAPVVLDLSQLKLGSIDVLNLNGIKVTDPAKAGAHYGAAETDHFTGLLVAASDPRVSCQVEVNGSTVDNNSLRTLVLSYSDVIVIKVTAADSSFIYYKITLKHAVNSNPVAVDDHYNVNQNGGYLFTPLDNDSDADNDTLTISSINQGAHGRLEMGYGTYQYRYLPNADYCGPDSFTYEISDGHNGTASATVYFTVNALPTAVNDNISVGKNGSVIIDVLSNDINPAGGTLSIWEFTQGAHGHVTQENNSLKYVPDSNFNGSDSFTYKLLNDFGALSTATVNVAVMDNYPIAVDDHYNVNQNGGYLFTPSDNDSDPDGDTLTIIKINQGAHGRVEMGYGSSQYRYVPNADYCGPDSFTYEISDGHNGTATATVYFTVNASPTAVNDSAIAGKGSSVIIDVLSNDINPAGGTLSIWDFTQGAHGLVTQEGNSLKYVPDSSFNGTDSFTYKLLNDYGALSTATVNVTADNAPVVLDLSQLKLGSIDVLNLNGIKVADPAMAGAHYGAAETDHFTGLLVAASDPRVNYQVKVNGSVIDNNSLRTLVLSYSDVIVIKVTAADSSFMYYKITLKHAVNSNPVAVDDHYNVNQNGGYLFTPLDNDSDADNDTLTISSINQGAHGRVEMGYGSSQYRYVANAGYCGPDSFTYEISDGFGGTATATVYFIVNALPTAVNDNAIVGKGSSVIIDVLSNDINPAGGTLSIWEFTQGAHGHVTLEGNSLKYVPDSSFNGTDSFTYKLLNDFGALSTATVNVFDKLPAPVLNVSGGDIVWTASPNASYTSVNLYGPSSNLIQSWAGVTPFNIYEFAALENIYSNGQYTVTAQNCGSNSIMNSDISSALTLNITKGQPLVITDVTKAPNPSFPNAFDYTLTLSGENFDSSTHYVLVKSGSFGTTISREQGNDTNTLKFTLFCDDSLSSFVLCGVSNTGTNVSVRYATSVTANAAPTVSFGSDSDGSISFVQNTNTLKFTVTGGLLTDNLVTNKFMYKTSSTDNAPYTLAGSYTKVNSFTLTPGQYSYMDFGGGTTYVQIVLTPEDAAAIKALSGYGNTSTTLNSSTDYLELQDNWYAGGATGGARNISISNLIHVTNNSSNSVSSEFNFVGNINYSSGNMGGDLANPNVNTANVLVTSIVNKLVFYVGTYTPNVTPTSGLQKIVTLDNNAITNGIVLDDNGWTTVDSINFGQS